MSHDALTDIFNREYFEQNKDKYNRCIDVPIGIILCDLDELKYNNDNFGHERGDLLIIETAKLLNRYPPNM
ncbi:diguanylate cyclase domain-containing protein [Bacillus sp. V5-8f]|uniref:diguanylate cyclase domain-containing protein n=1 Tax=Bacillus sp. V5-8f TaxID=2053044 RepID=UPI000C78F409|nr:hypothetical protein CUU64_11085 [Bacillus sp. V5-8f]